jgi:hypothetical protein
MLKYGCSFDEAEDTKEFIKVAGSEELQVPNKKPQQSPESKCKPKAKQKKD